jgi:hypothetical protein
MGVSDPGRGRTDGNGNWDCLDMLDASSCLIQRWRASWRAVAGPTLPDAGAVAPDEAVAITLRRAVVPAGSVYRRSGVQDGRHAAYG